MAEIPLTKNKTLGYNGENDGIVDHMMWIVDVGWNENWSV